MSQTVAIEELQVGMFVHLDLGWWAHPFALSSFLVTAPDQIETIRGLGLKQLRWSPEMSRLPEAPLPPGTAGAGHAGDAADAIDGGVAAATADASDANSAPGDAADPVNTAAAEAALSAAESAAADASPQARLRATLAQQHAARELCEQQYGEAGRAWHEAQRQVPTAPENAREITEGLTRSLLDKLMVDREMCVRVLSDVGGDRISGHALNVAVIALLMGRVFGFSDDEMLDLGMGALLHDVGKLDLPVRVHHADPQLSSAEQAAYREHVALGLAHGRRMGLREGAMQVLAQHHEMADGSGFPARLNLDRMVIGARIVSLINRYDNLCNPAQVAQALTPHEALSLIFAQARTKFDATMLNAFIRMMGVYPPGSLVQLTDDRFATVVSCNSSRPLKPRVLVCDTRVPVDEALLLNLDGQADLGIRRSLKATQLPAAARDYLSPRQRMVYFFEPVFAGAADHSEALAA
ncbi:MAG: phosphohydrolase [Burkholderiales bacterium RIFCSPHIGHO2_12_FULL_69_20]|nr:MAG: phosphohydrolase [Burkholderiales bacterium RIFCSPHIGHO2_12_FULL_69_20]